MRLFSSAYLSAKSFANTAGPVRKTCNLIAVCKQLYFDDHPVLSALMFNGVLTYQHVVAHVGQD